MTVKLHHLEFLSLKGGCTGSFESSLVKMPHDIVGNYMLWLIYWLAHDFGRFIRAVSPKFHTYTKYECRESLRHRGS